MTLILKFTDKDFKTRDGFQYPSTVGERVSCENFKNTIECGNGLQGFLNGEGKIWTTDYFREPDYKTLVLEVEGVFELEGKVKFKKAVVKHVGDLASCARFIKERVPESSPFGEVKEVGNEVIEKVNHLGVLTGGNYSTLTGGNYSTLTGGEGSTLTGGNYSTLTGGVVSTLTGGDESILKGGAGSTLTGGNYSTLKGGDYSSLIGGEGSTLTGGVVSTLTGGDYSSLIGGNGSILIGGDYSSLTGGDESTLTGGDGSILIGGNGSILTGGDESILIGGDGSFLTGGEGSILKGGDESTLIFKYFCKKSGRTLLEIGHVGKDLKEGVPYRLNQDNEIKRII